MHPPAQIKTTIRHERGVARRTVPRSAQIGLAVMCVLLATGTAYGADSEAIQEQDLTALSIEDLSNIQVTSVSKHAEKLSDAPASIYVITSDDIRRSGANSLPDALRLAPNLQVAEVANGQYAISARGFNNAIGNKLLVLIDGRTVYTPLYSGVFWNSQFVMLEDIDRIEVISGPGGTLWGANAVNGVINIITRRAQDTQGGLVAAGDGNRTQSGSMRYGGKIGDDGYFRVYAMGQDSKNTTQANGLSAADDWQTGQAGFRADWQRGGDTYNVQGDVYRGKTDPDPAGTPTVSGDNLMTHWTHQLEGGSNFSLQAYYDHTVQDDPYIYRDEEYIFDIQLQHAFTWGDTNRILWGGGYRQARDDTKAYFYPTNPLPEAFLPADANLNWKNLFVQDEWSATANLTITAGIKAETNVYTGVEYLPSLRFAWKPSGDQLWWGEISRAVRAPSRLDTDFYVYLHLPHYPLFPVIEGGPDFQSEVADVIELGYRSQPSTRFSYSVTTFFSFYSKLRSGEPPPAVVQNMMEGSTYGLEAWGNYQLTPNWRLSAGLTELREDLRIEAGSLDPTGPSALGNDPKYQFQLRSSLNIDPTQELDMIVHRIGSLPNPVVPAYTSMDLRYGWKARPNLEISLTAQNLFANNHVEFGSLPTRSEIPTGVYLKGVWRY